ncbi:MAG: type II toxin-antitoxin system Phd/YefM family antitoxin [Candidatus Dormibacteraceae bacterium]
MGTVHGNQDSIIPAGEFKQGCLALLTRVSEEGASLLITKRGRPVARVVPVDAPAINLRGSLRVLATEDELLSPLQETWAAEQEG